MIPLVVHSECILTGTSFITNEAVISSVLYVPGLYVLGHITLYFRTVGTLATLPHGCRLTGYSEHLGLDLSHKVWDRKQTCRFIPQLSKL